jgi:hypothetical protein
MKIAIGVCAILLLCLFSEAEALDSLKVVTVKWTSGVPQWNPAPLCSHYTPHGIGTCGCRVIGTPEYPNPVDGFDDFDQIWGPLVTPVWGKVNISYMTACGGPGTLRVSLADPSSCLGDAILVLTISQSSSCIYSSYEINLASFGFLPGEEYLIRLWMPANAFTLYSFKITPVSTPTAVTPLCWGRLKVLYR